jgi:amidase
MDELIGLSARRMVELLRAGEVTPAEALEASLARIAATDGAINALPTLCAERAADAAAAIAAGPAPDGAPWLAGLPISVKDLTDVAGVRTTYGSPIFADHLPERSDILVETLEERGAVVVAKSNTPEFGAGSNTFNEVFGKTRNPWDTSRTCGGSSGGAAAALAAGQVWLSTGSDLGGSLRTPAAFCSVAALRPGPGLVARAPARLPFDTLAVHGPMGRTVGDVALMFDAMVGAHRRDPLAMAAPAGRFIDAVDAPRPPARVAFSRDLGVTPMTAAVADVCAAAAARFAELGAEVVEATPDLSDAGAIFRVLREARAAAGLGPMLEDHRDQFKPELAREIEAGMALSADEVGRAERARGALFARLADFFAEVDVLLCPAMAVEPFDVDRRYVEEIEGQALETYYDWFAITYALSLTGCPVMSLPCGFTAGGLPVGLQMVAPPRREADLLGVAALAESLLGVGERTPIDPRPPAAA